MLDGGSDEWPWIVTRDLDITPDMADPAPALTSRAWAAGTPGRLRCRSRRRY
jgi:hypothetical protein